VVVGVFGTTISPYMFFWQASQEVEEEIAEHMDPPDLPRLRRFLHHVRIDTLWGMIFAEVIQWFIIVVCATVLFSHGITNIHSAAEAASALAPFAGVYAKDLFALGVVGVGLMAIPVFAGASSFAISEAMSAARCDEPGSRRDRVCLWCSPGAHPDPGNYGLDLGPSSDDPVAAQA
jgi:Mn2+/Fe2+ NRAMP family transporter